MPPNIESAFKGSNAEVHLGNAGQEMTLTFVPKILAIFVSILLFLPFMITNMITFMERLMERVVAGG